MSTSIWEMGNTDYFVPMTFILLSFTLDNIKKALMIIMDETFEPAIGGINMSMCL